MLIRVFHALGRQVARTPRTAIVVWVLLAGIGYALAVLGVHGENLFDRLSTGEPSVEGSESKEGRKILFAMQGKDETVTLIVTGVDPADPAVEQVVAGARGRLSGVEGVASVIDPYALPQGVADPAAAPLLAADGRGFLVTVDVSGGEDTPLEQLAAARADGVHQVADQLRALPGELRASNPDAAGLVESNMLLDDAFGHQIEQDLRTGETIALPIALIVMVLVFGGFLAAAMPMAGALASIGAGLGTLLGISHLIEVDASVVNVITLLGIGLSIDYGLLIVSRYREELHRAIAAGVEQGGRRRRTDPAVAHAVARTMATAGRTVAYSALTVGISIAGLMVFRPEILRAIGAGGLAVILIAVATALTLVPALLTLAGRRLLRPGIVGRIPLLRSALARTADVQSDEGVFSRIARRVQRRPVLTLVSVLAVLLALAAPAAGIQLRNSGIELLPSSSPHRQYFATLAEQYSTSAEPDVSVVTESSLDASTAWVAGIEDIEGVARVGEPVAGGPYTVIGVDIESPDPGGPEATRIVREIRELSHDFPVWVTGQAAVQLDFSDSLAQRVLPAVLVVVVATFVLLFLMTGSLLIPVKALLTNALSLSASLGVLVWVFQQGHLSGLLGFESTGGIETYVVALVIAFGFGLAMDYEVFLLARVKEAYDAGVPNEDAVALGLQRSGRIISSAAAIIIVVFLGFMFGDLLVIKQVGFALAFTVLLDATLVRMLLVPATMTLLKDWNWWAPGPLRRLHRRFAIAH